MYNPLYCTIEHNESTRTWDSSEGLFLYYFFIPIATRPIIHHWGLDTVFKNFTIRSNGGGHFSRPSILSWGVLNNIDGLVQRSQICRVYVPYQVPSKCLCAYPGTRR